MTTFNKDNEIINPKEEVIKPHSNIIAYLVIILIGLGLMVAGFMWCTEQVSGIFYNEMVHTESVNPIHVIKSVSASLNQ